MRLDALAARHELTWTQVETALFVTGPLHVFSMHGFRNTVVEWNEGERRAVLELSRSVGREAGEFLVKTVNELDAKNQSGGTSVEFVTRVLNTLCMLGLTVCTFGPSPSWEGLVEKFVMRKRKGEK